jgi:coenzyme PQQ synthesis protein D (PqqD)
VKKMPDSFAFVPKRKDAIVRQLSDEFLVYDKATNKAHCLNRSAAQVWKLCDGKRSVAEIVREMKKGTTSPLDEQMVWVALAQLGKAGLLQNRVGLSSRTGNLSRRQALRKAGAAAAALAVPVIASVLVPKAEAAVSCSTLSQPCNPKPCCTGMLLTCVAHVCV